jgi:hypothetical protein
MDAVKPGSAVSLARNTVVFWGFQTEDESLDTRFRPVVSLSYIILDEDEVDVTSHFATPGSPLGGIPLSTTVTDVGDLAAAEIYPGLYAAEFEIPLQYDPGGGNVDQVPGRYFIEWTYESTDGETGTQQTSFRLIDPAYPLVRSYVQVQDAIDEGITIDDNVTPASGTYTSAWVKKKIEIATKQVRRYTGRQFGISAEKRLIKSYNRPYVKMGSAVIGLATIVEVTASLNPLYGTYSGLYDTTYWIPNRHIRYQTDFPDDKRRPVLKKANEFDFVENSLGTLVVQGVFGWTDADDRTVWGEVPQDIVQATVQIAIANIAPAADVIADAESSTSGAVKTIQTLDQKVVYDTSSTAVVSGSASEDQGQINVRQVLSFYKDAFIIAGMA